VQEFHERLAQKVGIAPEMAARYARHPGDVVGDAMPGPPPDLPAADPAFDLFEDRALDARVLE
jgi:hypothetical protein